MATITKRENGKWHEPCTFQNQCVSYTQGISRLLNEVEIEEDKWPHTQSQTAYGLSPHVCLEISKKHKTLRTGIPFITRYDDFPFGCLMTEDGVIFNANNYGYIGNDRPYSESTCESDKTDDYMCLFRNEKLNQLPVHVGYQRLGEDFGGVGAEFQKLAVAFR